MKIAIPRIASRLAVPLLAAAALGGCAVYDDGYHSRTSYSGSVYVSPAPVYVAPHFGVHYRSGPRYYPRHYRPYRPYRPAYPHHHRPRPGWRR